MKKIALIDNEPDVFRNLKSATDREGFKLVSTGKGRDAVELCQREKPDLIILEVTLPDCDGFEVCRMLQRNPRLMEIPIMFLTARDSESDRLIGLELGASDYIAKPFYVREVVARIKSQLRKGKMTSPALRCGSLEIDRQACQVKVGDKEIVLTATEFGLLEYLVSHPKIVFKRAQLLDAVWGFQREVTERTVDVFMLRLRRKLGGNNSNHHFLHSVRGFGYRFDPDLVESSLGSCLAKENLIWPSLLTA